MFGLFKPKSPLRTGEKTWTEFRMCWLAEKLGLARMRNAKVILPTEEFFPDPYLGDDASARRLLDRVCEYLDFDPASIAFEVCEDVQLPFAAGHYDASRGTTIRVSRSQLAEPMKLVATLAHEVAHTMLLGQRLLTGEETDHEPLTDLLPLYLGLGIFGANATVTDKSGFTGGWSWWALNRQGYLPSRIFGYAFALFAHVRGEHLPNWAEYLRLDARAVMKEGMHFLKKTGDTMFRPDRLDAGSFLPADVELTEWLGNASPTFRLAALMELTQNGMPRPDLIEAIERCLSDPDPDIPGWAAGALAGMGPQAAPVLSRLLHLLNHGNEDARAGTARALGALRLKPKTVIPALIAALKYPGRTARYGALLALAAYGRRARQAARPVMDLLVYALIEVDDSLSGAAAFALLSILPKLKNFVRDYFAEGDRELRRRTWHTLKEQHRLRKESRTREAGKVAPAPSTPDEKQGGVNLG